MKIEINEYEIEVKAKRLNENRASKRTTMQVLNTISIWAAKAAKIMRAEDCPTLAKEYEEIADKLYRILKSEGLYDK